MISDKEAEETLDKIFNRSECLSRLKEITPKNKYNKEISTYLLEFLDDVRNSYIFGLFAAGIVLSGTVLAIALTEELVKKGYSKKRLDDTGLYGLIKLAKKKGIIRETAIETAVYLFSIGAEFEDDLNKEKTLSNGLKKKFEKEKVLLSGRLTIMKENNDKWGIYDELKIFTVKKEEGVLKIYSDNANALQILRNMYAHPPIKEAIERAKSSNHIADWSRRSEFVYKVKPHAKKAIECINEILLEIYPKERYQLKEL
ncbi:MAG: hypothetical protein KAT65_07015 [Methanophagales archaeon]|nr:hypothetical protein [Methanophagales archaeon]